MITYIGDTGTDPSTIPQIQAYNGSAWQGLGGLTQVANVSFTSASSISIDNVFSSTYANYLIVINQTATSGTGAYQLRFRTSGTDNTNSNYNYITERQSTNDALFITSNARNANIAILGTGNYGSHQQMFIDITNPNLSERTLGKMQYVDEVGNSGTGALAFTATTVFDGFSLIPVPTTAVTGTVRIYGYRNS
jgi:hypothetical protein